ncbi:hypothetical protein HAX54_046688 [Datura stramonium]|uniref:Uncharacterized protein n=1 Tax=Datura stramonium TaxID=4076 RepID=A0ABS8WHE5_DATST|nr:hypothetical protein [Datura stramonium]
MEKIIDQRSSTKLASKYILRIRPVRCRLCATKNTQTQKLHLEKAMKLHPISRNAHRQAKDPIPNDMDDYEDNINWIKSYVDKAIFKDTGDFNDPAKKNNGPAFST